MSMASSVIEINLISAQQLGSDKLLLPVMHTYVVASWINRQQKLTSRVDAAGGKNPTWNDKFMLAIPEDLAFERPNLTLVFEIYRKRFYWKDKLVGRVHVLLDSLMDDRDRRQWGDGDGESRIGGKVMAFLVRTPSGMPRGILNIGVINLDGLFNHAMPTFLRSSFAIDHRKLMGTTR
jgi:hypothetical protein